MSEQRYRPTRAGIINLWDYRDEEFLFVDGWLVLRGPNGSGKTKALEVLFPFVLDGRIEPRRLNPFAGEDRTMKANLLYRGQEVSHGYVWMEFSDGDHFVTIGIGLRAHRHVDKVSRWHFVADGRVGVDISLLDGEDRPLQRKSLVQQLGAEAVRDSAEEYRHLVDTRLFGLGAARYDQMLELVLTLRRPQLAKDLNPAALSTTLQRGLRPLDEHLLVEAAGSFDDMEAVAHTLEGLVAADTATAAFLSVYTTYLRTHARSAADAVTARLETVGARTTEVSATRTELDGAVHAEGRAASVASAAAEAVVRARARLDSLKQSAAYQSHQQLTDLQNRVVDLARAVDGAETALGRQRSAARARADETERARLAHHDAQVHTRRTADRLAQHAETAGIAWSGPDAETGALSERVRARSTARAADLAAVREAAGRVEVATRDRGRAASALTEAQAAVADAERGHDLARTAETEARGAVAQALSGWADRWAEVLATADVPDLGERLAGELARVGEPDAPGLGETYRAATSDTTARLHQELATTLARRAEQAERHETVRAERERIAGEQDDHPPADPTRPAARKDRAGAPLWRLVRFADAVDDATAGAVEAALHASGLLDAWLLPDGESTATAVTRGDEDAFLTALPPARRPSGTTLADLLVPEDHPLVPAARITEVLASVAVRDAVAAEVDAPGAVDRYGRYAHGLLLGTHAKERAEYIGATARSVRRAARLRECDRQLAELESILAGLDATAERIRTLLADIDAAAAALPPTRPITQALARVVTAAATLHARRDTSEAASTAVDRAIAEENAAAGALRRISAERALPVDRIAEIDAAVRDFSATGARLADAYRAVAATTDALAGAEGRQQESAAALAEAETDRAEAGQRHADVEETYRTLREAIGAEAEQVLADIASAGTALNAAEHDSTAATEAATAAREARATAAAHLGGAEQALSAARTEAGIEARRLRPFARPDLLGLLRADPDLRWPALDATDGDGAGGGVHPAVLAIHRALLAATPDLTPTETSLKQSATRLTTSFNDLLAQLPAAGLDHRPELDTDDNLFTVQIADEQGLSPVALFAERIARERRDQEQLLTDSEQRIFEDALLGQLARQIHTRTIEAKDLVVSMDVQLRARRMSSGLALGVGWRLADDLDEQQREVCKLLDRNPASLGPAQLAQLRRHFAARIKAARAVAAERPYRELLAEVLDYRRWRVFSFTLHRPGGSTEALTRARHSQLSGGEQSTSLHLPLFAAANALFGSARRDAPRMLGLDEAFAGVDDNGRAELMGLAGQFDLDLVMTGYDLWATHPQVRGAAHYDLSHSAAEHTVATVLLVWNGSENLIDIDGSLARALGSPETRRAPGVTGRSLDASLDPDLEWASNE